MKSFFQISPFKGLLERASTFTYSRGRWGSKRENESPEPSQDETSCPGFWLHSSSLHGRKRWFNQVQAFSLDQQKLGHCRPRTKMWYLGQRGRTLFSGPQGSPQATESQKHSDHLHGHPGLDLPGLAWLQMSRGWWGPLTLCPWKLPFCSLVSLQSNWLVPFLLPFHPFLFIFFIFIFHLKCFSSHAFPSSEACTGRMLLSPPFTFGPFVWGSLSFPSLCVCLLFPGCLPLYSLQFSPRSFSCHSRDVNFDLFCWTKALSSFLFSLWVSFFLLSFFLVQKRKYLLAVYLIHLVACVLT